MDYGIISCIPIAVLVIGSVLTKRLPEMMMLACIVGSVILYKGNFFNGLIDMLYGALSNASYQYLLMIVIGFGGFISLLQKSGALLGFSNVISRYANTRKKAMVATWFMGVIMFVDDYLNVLATSFTMRDITDRNKIPREHLAYGVNSMGACVCVLIPFTSWAAFATGILKEQGFGYGDYIRSIPFMFFPILAILICLLVALNIIPKIGPLKAAYIRVDAGGELLIEEKAGTALVDMEMNTENLKASSPWNFILPIIALIVSMIYWDGDVVRGVIVALIVQIILYITLKIVTPSEFIETFFDGIKGMATLAFVVAFCYVLASVNESLGFTTYIIDSLSKTVAPELLPALVFIVVSLIAFGAASFWALIVITVPIFIPLAVGTGADVHLVIAAIMSAVAFGSKFCFYSDAVFMTSAGTGVSNMRQIKVVAPYVLGGAVIATLLFAMTGMLL